MSALNDIDSSSLPISPVPRFLASPQVRELEHRIMSLPRYAIVSICGPSGSGKTTLAQHLANQIVGRVLSMDTFYKPIPEIPEYLPSVPMFDSPDAFDFDLIRRALSEIRDGRSVWIPIYNYFNSAVGRDTNTQLQFSPIGVTLFEGILSYYNPLHSFIDLAVYVHRDPSACRTCRLHRDVQERGVDAERARLIYDGMTRPLEPFHVYPQRNSAHLIVTNA